MWPEQYVVQQRQNGKDKIVIDVKQTCVKYVELRIASLVNKEQSQSCTDYQQLIFENVIFSYITCNFNRFHCVI
jgi:hypothetical protein